MIYLDNSATTAPCAAAVQAVRKALEEDFGNPSSLHAAGITAERAVRRARGDIAASLGVGENEIFFTSGATESNNTALFGAVHNKRRAPGRIVTTAIEHPSVLRCMDALEKEGFEVVRVKPREGCVRAEDLDEAITPQTVLVSIMAVNNETGEILPVKAAAESIRRKKAPALLHCDAVQAYGKLPLYPARWGIDLMSISGHKLYGPKGIGALYKRKGLNLPPLLLGGGQETGLRSGTENVPGIVGFGAAVQDVFSQAAEFREHLSALGSYAERALGKIPGVVIQSPPGHAPYILNFSLPGILSETVLHELESFGIFVSAGSACSAHAKGSHVLAAYGYPDAQIRSSVRVSLGRENTCEEIDVLCDTLAHCIERFLR